MIGFFSWITGIDEGEALRFEKRAEEMAYFLDYYSDDFWDCLRSNLRRMTYDEVTINTLYWDLFSYASEIMNDKYKIDEGDIDWNINHDESYMTVKGIELPYEGSGSMEDFIEKENLVEEDE